MKFIENWIEKLLTDAGIQHSVVEYLRLLILIIVAFFLAALIYFICKKLIVNYLYKFFKKSKAEWDDVLADKKVFNNLAHIFPAIFFRLWLPLIFKDFPGLISFVEKATDAYLIIVSIMVVVSVLKIIEYNIAKSPLFVDKPVSSYFQLARIILYITAGILVLSVLLGRSPLYFLGAFGAMSAVLMLIFKDTILGLVASVQIASNDMVRVGDWVEMPKFNADGDVTAINLNTVKVQNFDKTISTVPTYYFITESFKNWRGMEESGGRRIKRSLYVNVQTVKFVDPETREKYKKVYLLKEYITQRQAEIENFNQQHDVDTSLLINGRRMTNLGVFRHYIQNYLKSHPDIHTDMTQLVRQLAIDEVGVPIEIYCFTKTTSWIKYEDIQADIFDHLLAAASFFGLEIFQKPGSNDIVNAVKAFDAMQHKSLNENKFEKKQENPVE